MGSKFIDMTGQQFGLWTALHVTQRGKPCTKWLCRCRCGTEREVLAGHLRSGASYCCGCEREPGKHGASRGAHREFPGAYKTWRAMRARCTNPRARDFKYYGGNGVQLCERWQDFANFLADMGQRPPGKTIDRFPDPKGNYEAGDCRWATQKQQVAALPQNQKGYRWKSKREEARA